MTWKSKANAKFSSYKFQSSKRIKRENWWEIPHIVIEPLSSTNDILYSGRSFEEKFLRLQLSENKIFFLTEVPANYHPEFICNCVCVCECVCVCTRMCAQSCPTLVTHMDCSPPGPSVHGILQARILEWVVISFSRRSSWSRDQTHITCTSRIDRRIFYDFATWVNLSVTNSII